MATPEADAASVVQAGGPSGGGGRVGRSAGRRSPVSKARTTAWTRSRRLSLVRMRVTCVSTVAKGGVEPPTFRFQAPVSLDSSRSCPRGQRVQGGGSVRASVVVQPGCCHRRCQPRQAPGGQLGKHAHGPRIGLVVLAGDRPSPYGTEFCRVLLHAGCTRLRIFVGTRRLDGPPCQGSALYRPDRGSAHAIVTQLVTRRPWGSRARRSA